MYNGFFSFQSHGKSKRLIDYLGKGREICIKGPLSSLTVYSLQHPQLYLINPRRLLAIPNVITIISKRRLSSSSTLSTLSLNQPAVILLMLSISSQSSRPSPSATLSSSSLNLQGYHYLIMLLQASQSAKLSFSSTLWPSSLTLFHITYLEALNPWHVGCLAQQDWRH